MQNTTHLKVWERMKRMGLATGLEREMQQEILLLLARLAGPEMKKLRLTMYSTMQARLYLLLLARLEPASSAKLSSPDREP